MAIRRAFPPLRSAVAMALWLLMASGAGGQNPPAPPSGPPAIVTADPFGTEVTLPERTIVFRRAKASWEEGWARILETYKAVRADADSLKLKPSGHPIVIYRSNTDEGFEFEAALPVEAAPSAKPAGETRIGPGPSGKALKFIHRGAFDAMDATYDLIADYLDAKGIQAEDLYIEEYETDPLGTKPDDLVIAIYVPLKSPKK